MLNFLEQLELKTQAGETIRMYKKEDVVRAQLGVLKDTYMLDLLEEKFQQIGETMPEETSNRREPLLAKITEAKEEVMPLLSIFESDEELQSMSEIKTLREICSVFDLESDVFEKVVSYAKMQYECGNYEVSKILLN